MISKKILWIVLSLVFAQSCFAAVGLISPADFSYVQSPLVRFISNATDSSNVVNATLYTNTSGSWAARETRWNGEIKHNDTGLLLLYHFNNQSAFGENSTKAINWVNSSNNLTLQTGSSEILVAGQFGGQAFFNGRDNAAYFASNSKFSTVPFTISMWVNFQELPSFQGEDGYLIFAGNTGTSNEYSYRLRVDMGDDRANFEVIDSFENSWNIVSDDALSGGFANLITIRIDESGLMNMFINDVRQGNEINIPDVQISPTNTTIFIGSKDIAALTSDATIDEFAFWNRTLSDQEISDMYSYSLVFFRPAFQNMTLSANGTYKWNVLSYGDGDGAMWAASNFSFNYNPERRVNISLASGNAEITQNSSFLLNATVRCMSGNCSSVTARVRFNSTTAYPNSTFLKQAGEPFNVTSLSREGICLQEYANRSTSCGALLGGVYSADGAWSNPGNVIDGDYSSASFAPESANGFYYINYTKPAGALNSSIWQIVSDFGTVNLTVPSSCWNRTDNSSLFQVRIATLFDSGEYTFRPQCHTGITWSTLVAQTYVEIIIYEEAMYWNISGGAPIAGLTTQSAELGTGDEVNFTWVMNATGQAGQTWKIDVAANSTDVWVIPSNSTEISLSITGDEQDSCSCPLSGDWSISSSVCSISSDCDLQGGNLYWTDSIITMISARIYNYGNAVLRNSNVSLWQGSRIE